MISLHLKTRAFSRPSTPLYYLVAGNGVFLVKQSTLFTSITRAQRLAGLERQSEALALRFPRLPRALLESAYGFFKAAYAKWRGEALVFLYYTPGEELFRLGIPRQFVSRRRCCGEWVTEGRMRYSALKRPPGFVKLGDIHSHGDRGAFFSSVDDRDDSEDGLRIVMGRIHGDRPEVCASFVSGGTRFRLRPEQVLEPFFVPRLPPPSWLDRLTCRSEDDRE
jgi:hypothetical protein